MAEPPQMGVKLDQVLKGKPLAPAPAAAVARAAAQPQVVTRERRVQTILASIEQLPSLPAVVWEVMRLANDPKSCARDFESHISKDQALTAKLLKLVNSAYYGLPNKVTSISRTIVVLGYKTLKSVVMAASTSKLLDRQLNLYGYAAGGLWMHSIACAGVARHLAANTFKLGLDVSEEAFVGGLLHDIGKIVISPVLYQNQQEFLVYIKGHPGAMLVDAELAVAGIDHADAGERMMKKWKLSARLADGIAAHHDESPEHQAEDQQFNDILQLANYLCHRIGMGLIAGYPWPARIGPHVIERLGIPADGLDAVEAEVQELEEDIRSLFSSLRDHA